MASRDDKKTAPGAAIVGGGKVEERRGQASSFSVNENSTEKGYPQGSEQKLTAFLLKPRKNRGPFQVIMLENLNPTDINALAEIVSKSPDVRLLADISGIEDASSNQGTCGGGD